MLIKPITAAITIICLLASPWIAPPSSQEATSQPVPGDKGWQLDDKWVGLFGAWQMMNLDHSTALVPDDSIRGYLTFQKGFMAMVIHAITDEEEPEALGQAGIYRWQVTDEGVLQTATMMGHTNFGLEFEWESPNAPREFRLELTENDLILTRPDLSRLIFRRVKPGAYPEIALRRIEDLRRGL